jgi:hypothetical protein
MGFSRWVWGRLPGPGFHTVGLPDARELLLALVGPANVLPALFATSLFTHDVTSLPLERFVYAAFTAIRLLFSLETHYSLKVNAA